MNLKRLEMIGFKSFADKTVIDFKDGITGIVGPNGSGKSNIADAIRWVLGEQRTKQLRGSNMQDVIFKGTSERQPLSYCEVSLVFDDAGHIFNSEYDEIAITRKLYRSGESEYLINKNVVRLKDITSMLHDVGIGKDGYSIIGQNKVTEIVQSKPIDRRKIFEEAAGISKFKQSKQESESKLKKVRENLNICQNVLCEIQDRVEPLRKQSEVTRKYLDLKDRLKSLEINNYIYQYDNANSMKLDIQTRIDALTEDLQDKNKTLSNVIKKSNENTHAVERIDINIAKLYNQLTNLKVAQEKNSGETKLLKEKQKVVLDELERIEQELLNGKQNLEREEAELLQENQEIVKNKEKTQTLNEEANTINNEYAQVLDKLTKSELGSANSQKVMLEALDKLSDAKSDLTKFNTEKESLTENNQNLKQELNELNNRFAQTKSQENRLSELLSSLKDRREKLKNEEEGISNVITKNTDILRDLEGVLNENIKKISSMESRLRILEDLEKDFNGYNNGVTSILKASKVNSKIKEHLIGVVANMIDVPQKFRTAIETALGNSVQNIIVNNEDDAKLLIEFLKNNRYGQATFLPLTSVKPRHLPVNEIVQFNMKGCYGIASDLIKFDPKIEKAVKSLLGAIVVCEDIHTAVNLAKLNDYNFKIVTLDGNQTATSGAISGGSQRSNASHILNREKDIKELKENLEKLKQEDLQNQQEKNALSKTVDESTVVVRKLRYQIQELEVEIAKNEETYETTLRNSKNEKREIEQRTTQISEISKRLLELEQKILSAKMIEENLSSNKNLANESMELTQKQAEELKLEKDKFQQKITDIRVQIAELHTIILASEEDILRLENSIATQKGIIDGLENSKNDKLTHKAEIEKEIALLQNTKQYIEIEKEIEKVDNKLASLDEYKKTLQTETKKLEEDRMFLTGTISSLTEKKNQEDINLTKVDMDLENMERRVWEGYELTYGTCQEYKIEDYDVEKGINEAQKCRRDIDRLGNVNLNAIEELEEQEARFNDMNEQVNDLLKAEQETNQIIDQLSKEMDTKFTSEFNKINENFSVVFKELFGGGRAELVLTKSESDDPLEQGVDIIAEPPKKKFANITLLSGGEQSLTAIAILFAILKLRNMPFVLLDEVEAALDDANIGRYAKYLKRFSASTQFIVITHRKGTMEQVDRLCGVTTQNTVSIVINTQLSDAVKMLDEDNAKTAK